MTGWLLVCQACHDQGVVSHFLSRSLQRLGDERSGESMTALVASRDLPKSLKSGLEIENQEYSGNFASSCAVGDRPLAGRPCLFGCLL